MIPHIPDIKCTVANQSDSLWDALELFFSNVENADFLPSAKKMQKNSEPNIFLLFFTSLSKLPYEVTPEQAMSHEEVRNRLEASSLALRSATDKVLNSIVSSLDNIP